MLREIPSRCWKSSNRVIPRKQSRTMSMVHHSPTTSRVWATEQFISSKLLRRMLPPYWVAWCNALQSVGALHPVDSVQSVRRPWAPGAHLPLPESVPVLTGEPAHRCLVRATGHPQHLDVDPRRLVEAGPPPVAQWHRLPVAALDPALRVARPHEQMARRPRHHHAPPHLAVLTLDLRPARCRRIERHPGEDHADHPRVVAVELRLLDRGEVGTSGEPGRHAGRRPSRRSY